MRISRQHRLVMGYADRLNLKRIAFSAGADTRGIATRNPGFYFTSSVGSLIEESDDNTFQEESVVQEN